MSSISRFSTSVHIARPVADVFAYVAEPGNLPHWNSAVQAVTGSGRRYVMHRRLPTGPAVNELEIVELDPPAAFTIQTTSGPTPFVYRYRFEPDGAGPLAVRAVRRGVDANLATLRSLLGSAAKP
jgi:uncharacterized protein YndB with AHSA1/START domain